MAVVCGTIHVVAASVVRNPGAEELGPGRITVLEDGRIRYEEHLRDPNDRVTDSIRKYDFTTAGRDWERLVDDPPPLRYRFVEHGIAYVLHIELRPGTTDPQTGHTELFIDAVIETEEPILQPGRGSG